MQNIRTLAYIVLSTLFFCTVALPAAAPKAQENPFAFTVADIAPFCEKKVIGCKIWITGVIEGMELSYTLMSPSERLDTRPTVFCFKDDEAYIDKIYDDLMAMLHSPEVKDVRNQQDSPAVVLLAPSLNKYLCHPH